jgi:hypothetical protein
MTADRDVCGVTSAESTEQRRHPRLGVQVPFLHRERALEASRVGVGWTRNISESGACLEVAELLEPRTPLRIRLRTDWGFVEADAEVTWALAQQTVWAREGGPLQGGVLHGTRFNRIASERPEGFRDWLGARKDGRAGGVRLPADLPVLCYRREGPIGPVHGRTRDINRKGAQLLLPEMLNMGISLDLLFLPENGSFPVQASVAWVDPTSTEGPGSLVRHGVRFPALSWSSSLSLGLALTVLG